MESHSNKERVGEYNKRNESRGVYALQSSAPLIAHIDISRNASVMQDIPARTNAIDDNSSDVSEFGDDAKGHVPKASMRTRDTIRHKGWIKRRVGFGIFKNWKRQFLSLWNDSILYFHRDDTSSSKFYNGKQSKNNAKGEINLRDIVGVRVVKKNGLPGNGRGIELVSSSGKVVTICPEGGENMFNKWLNRLRNIISKLNRERYERTGDVEYRKDVREVAPRNFGKKTLNDIRSSLMDVESYDVDPYDIDKASLPD